ncbi:97b5cd40-78b5-441f-8fbe-a7ad2864f7d1 [Sclerotinia trifoliorum]|uniref:Conserved oligomeric Golgi complex subunit 1 n=1 Tax=Sclerotinia trifoliorum TaxID=28548 RepID=A0A8H2W044_9HELO|nr:97b5cd40-78b5-441f-8fbe-a7ad2864f7d1 [Sclerotinia trifoliorum]
MASTTLSTTTCFTSSEAFKHPLPQIRQFHRDLTTELDEKNARLRTLVGGSYRQLLGTAEQILQMRKDIREVEEKLGKGVCGGGKEEEGGLTKRLLRAVEKTLVSTKDGEDREDLVQALCAYSLATSSGAKDVLRHFLNRSIGCAENETLLKDESIRDLEGLRLDVCERWFGDEILYFTPYVRHDDLEGSLAVDTLRGWAKKASEVLLEGFTKTLQGGLDFKVVVELRTKILEVWIRDGGKARGFDPSILRDGLRGVVNKRLVELLETRVGKLHLVGTEIESTLATWDKGITDHHASLWDEDMMATELSNGGNIFKQDIIARTFGRNDTVSRVVNSFQTWRHLIEEIGTVIDELKKQRWDDDLEDIEDDESLDSRQNLLSKEDPQMLQGHLDSSLEKAFQELHTKITTFVEQYKDSEHSGKISMYILRILRDIRAELPSNPSLQKFVAGRALWEGTPELPVQPSPATFKFLRGLSTSMADAGADLWSPVAIKTLKVHLDSQVKEKWSKVLQEKTASNEITASSIDTSDAQNSAETEESEKEVHSKVDGELDEEKQKDLLKQYLFDIFVLQQALASQSKQSGDMEKGITGMKLKDLSEEIEVKIKLEMQERKRVGSAAKEYWKRTGLLFGFLV